MMSPVPGPEAPATGAAAASSLSPASPPLLQLRGVDKHFGAVQALYHVDLDLPAAQVTALCGDNGAGKSVLTRCIAGIHQPITARSSGTANRSTSGDRGMPLTWG